MALSTHSGWKVAECGRLPSGAVERRAVHELGERGAEAAYERDHVLWVRLPSRARRRCAEAASAPALSALVAREPALFAANFACENGGGASTCEGVFGRGGELGRAGATFYCSSILQGDAEGVRRVLGRLPVEEAAAALPGGAEHDCGAWLFVGKNGAASALRGRPEHTDSVAHSGTYHVQLAGSKTWHIRPKVDAPEWGGCPPAVEGSLAVRVEQGDVFLLNTRIWWHRTEIEPQALSVSVARDIYLGEAARALRGADGAAWMDAEASNGSELDPRLYVRCPVAAGSVALEEPPDRAMVPATLDAASCEWGEGPKGPCLVAVRALVPGEVLCVAADSDASYDEYTLDSEGEMVPG